SARTLSRDLVAHPDGTIEGWFPSGSTGHGTSIAIDPEGRVRQRSLPFRTNGLVSAGRFAMAVTEDHRLLETTDRGRTFHEVIPPPGGAPSVPVSCSLVGCDMGGFVRIGWGSPEPSTTRESSPPPASARSRSLTTAGPPVARIACRFAAPAAATRLPDSY